jgi:hypothetical protein
VAERPYLVHLDALRLEAAQRVMLVGVADLADLAEQFLNRVLCDARHTHRGADAHTLADGGENAGPVV